MSNFGGNDYIGSNSNYYNGNETQNGMSNLERNDQISSNSNYNGNENQNNEHLNINGMNGNIAPIPTMSDVVQPVTGIYVTTILLLSIILSKYIHYT